MNLNYLYQKNIYALSYKKISYAFVFSSKYRNRIKKFVDHSFIQPFISFSATPPPNVPTC